MLVSEIYEYDQVLSRVQLADGTEVTRRAKTVIEEIQPRYNSETTKSETNLAFVPIEITEPKQKK